MEAFLFIDDGEDLRECLLLEAVALGEVFRGHGRPFYFAAKAKSHKKAEAKAHH
ncbi:hypothetical protein CsSME_00025495 [Camellia sinensis var. sinensis]